jgi:hypothetical protein
MECGLTDVADRGRDGCYGKSVSSCSLQTYIANPLAATKERSITLV